MTDAHPRPPLSLPEVRARIDAVDDELLALLHARAELAHAVAAAKRSQAGPGTAPFGLRPARETQVIRRLLAEPRQGASAGLVVRLWRELMTESLAIQGPVCITAFGGRDAGRIGALTRLRFGAAAPLTVVDTPEAALAAARAPGGIAVVPLEGAAWVRLLAEPRVKAFAILPCLTAWGAPTAIAAADTALEPSGADQTLWVTDAPGPAQGVIDALGALGLAAGLLAEGGGLRLFALPGFVQPDDRRLKSAPGRLTGVIGTAPTPFDL